MTRYLSTVLNLNNMSTTSIGRLAEQKASDYLQKEYSYKLLSQNWRTRTCEVDLIMTGRRTVHFIEVKYRKNFLAGGGIASISPNKLNRMYRASEEWLEQKQKYKDYQINIAAIELTGEDLTITSFIETITYDS